MRRLILAASLALTATTLSAQQLTERIDVNLVNVDVTVTSHGKPARGLTRDDFEVLEDGVPQTITNFYAIQGTRPKPASAPPAVVAEPAPAAAPADERLRRRVLVIVDNRHTSRHNRDVALQRLEQFIDDRFASGAYDWSLAMIRERAYVLLPLTSDKARIHTAIGQVRDAMAERSMRQIAEMDAFASRDLQPPDPKVALKSREEDPKSNSRVTGNVAELIGKNAAEATSLRNVLQYGKRLEQAADITITYSAIRDAIRSFANTPGRKIVLVLTGSFNDDENPLGSADPSLGGDHAIRMTSLRQRLIRDANASNASLYIVDVEGLQTLNATADLTQDQSNARVFGNFSDPTTTVGGPLYWIARETGGRMFTGNFVERSLLDFDVSSSDYYSLAYRPNHPIDGKYHLIKVRLKKPGRESLVYRTGYSAVSVEQQLARAMTSANAAEIQPSAITVTMMFGPVSSPDAEGVTVPVYAVVPSSALQFLPARNGLIARVDVYVSVFDARGRLVTRFRSIREARANAGTENTGNFIESETMRLRKGVPYRIVVAVHDQISDAVGIKSRDIQF